MSTAATERSAAGAGIGPQPPQLESSNRFESQDFVGAGRISVKALVAATGLRKGDRLSRPKLRAAQRAIAALYGKPSPGKEVNAKPEFHQNPNGSISITWTIGERPSRHLEAQIFKGNSRISSSILAATTGLKKGQPYSSDVMQAARTAIKALYFKTMPGKFVSVTKQAQVGPNGGVVLTWFIEEPK